jgi:hypothetical protein
VVLHALPALLAGDVVSRQLKPCGTEAAYQRHVKRDEQPCDPCQQARTDAQTARSRRRRADPTVGGRARADARARSRALYRLAGEYPARFAGLLVEELAREATP